MGKGMGREEKGFSIYVSIILLSKSFLFNFHIKFSGIFPVETKRLYWVHMCVYQAVWYISDNNSNHLIILCKVHSSVWGENIANSRFWNIVSVFVLFCFSCCWPVRSRLADSWLSLCRLPFCHRSSVIIDVHLCIPLSAWVPGIKEAIQSQFCAHWAIPVFPAPW